MYIHELPYLERKELCNLLDQNNKYEELAINFMKYDLSIVQMIKREIFRGNSPSEELLTLWSHQNHSVTELFILLYRMKHYQGMRIIKKFVESKFHSLIKYESENNSQLIVEENIQQNVDLLSCENNELVDVIKPKSPISHNFKLSNNHDLSCVVESAGNIPHIPYESLQAATDNWNSTSILGKGGFGTVFKGIWKCTQVAIKRIEQKEDSPESHNEQIRQSITELHCLNSYRHDNILPLYGFSVGGPQPCLVYQFMPGGSLDYRLHSKSCKKILNWPVRLNIAIGTARGLQFLHTIGDKPLIHGDIKSANILLDPNDTPRIGDFGLAREGPQSHYTHIKVSKIHGTRPYLPDEFLRAKKFSTKVDTYSFGVVLFEIATGLCAYSERYKHKFLKDHILNYEGDINELKDKKPENDDNYDNEEIFNKLIHIGKICVHTKAKERPEMIDVLMKLETVV